MAISTPSAQAAYNATKKIPILITAVTDAESAGLVGENITGTSDAAPIYKQLEIITKLLPEAKKVGIFIIQVNKTHKYKWHKRKQKQQN